MFFLPSVLLLYYILPSLRYRNTVLLLASLLFYAWGEPNYVFLMLASIIGNYNAGLLLTIGSIQRRKLVLCIAVIANLIVLFVYKYLGFSCTVLDVFLRTLHLQPLTVITLTLPLGISFYTFQEISYLVDVYHTPSLVQHDVLQLGLYIAFFPQLIAGPIVRYHDINQQMRSRLHTVAGFSRGMERFIIGLGKKVLLANNFALVCDTIYGADFFSYGAYHAWIAAFAYALQIYYDFSGYSDMAIGLAGLFGFHLPENFNYPYAAASLTDFWRRWHISLTSFFRDYVYIPLGGNRRGNIRTAVNRCIVFLTTGFWHGAAVSFGLWGLGHGTLMTIERVFIRKQQKPTRAFPLKLMYTVLAHGYTLLAVMLLWVLFRNGTLLSIKLFLKMVGVNYTSFTTSFRPFYYDALFSPHIDRPFYVFAALGTVFAFPWWRKMLYCKFRAVATIGACIKYTTLLAVLILCYARLAADSYNPFIYFRF